MAIPRPRRDGHPCETCRTDARVRRRVEAEAAAFNEARREGRAPFSWELYHRALTGRIAAYRVHDYRSMVRHLRRCLGWTIH